MVTFKSKTGRKLSRNARTRRKRLPVRILPGKRMGFRLSLHRLALARGMRNDLRGKKFRNLFYRYGKSGIKARLRNVYQQRRFAPLFSGAKQFYAEYRFFAPTARRKKTEEFTKNTLNRSSVPPRNFKYFPPNTHGKTKYCSFYGKYLHCKQTRQTANFLRFYCCWKFGRFCSITFRRKQRHT